MEERDEKVLEATKEIVSAYLAAGKVAIRDADLPVLITTTFNTLNNLVPKDE